MYRGLGKLFAIFFKLGATTFGGGYAMLPLMYQELCEKHDYVPEEEMSEMIVVAQSMPGVMSVNCATQVGYKLYGKLGAFICSLGVVIPSYLIIVLLAGLLMQINDNLHVLHAFSAIRAVVAGMIVAAAYKMFLQIKQDHRQIFLMIVAFLCAILLDINPFIFVIIGAIIGYAMTAKTAKGENKK